MQRQQKIRSNEIGHLSHNELTDTGIKLVWMQSSRFELNERARPLDMSTNLVSCRAKYLAHPVGSQKAKILSHPGRMAPPPKSSPKTWRKGLG